MKAVKGFTVLEMLLAAAGSFIVFTAGFAGLVRLLEWQARINETDVQWQTFVRFESVFRSAWVGRLNHSRANPPWLHVLREPDAHLRELRFAAVDKNGHAGKWVLAREGVGWILTFQPESKIETVQRYRFRGLGRILCQEDSEDGGRPSGWLHLHFPDLKGSAGKIGIAVSTR